MTAATKSPPPEIKNAIKVLIRRGVDQDSLQIIDDALSNPEIDNQCWLELFDSQGAKDAVEQKFYSPEMIRLLTLQAMVLPTKLLLLLDWLGQKTENDNVYRTCHEFQSGIRDSLKTLPAIEKNILVGVTVVIPELLVHPERLSTTSWLLKDQAGAWSELYRQIVRNNLDSAFKNNTHLTNFTKNMWDPIVNDVVNTLQSEQSKSLTHYRIFGDLFCLTYDYEISAIFYHASIGKVPKKVVNSLAIEDFQVSDLKVYGHLIKPQYNFFDLIIKFLEFSVSLLIKIVAFCFTAIKFLFVFLLIFGLAALELLIFFTLLSEMRYMTPNEFIEVVVGIMILRFTISVIVVIVFGIYMFISSLFRASPT